MDHTPNLVVVAVVVAVVFLSIVIATIQYNIYPNQPTMYFCHNSGWGRGGGDFYITKCSVYMYICINVSIYLLR